MPETSTPLHCEGWWEQRGWGRQDMQELTLAFDGERVSGSGHDMVGVFRFEGTIDAQGRVAMVKRYFGKHNVDYVGTYDGEGLLQGQWRMWDYDRGTWLIWIKKGSAASESEIEEWVPVAR